ncbi:MAG: hypothetical protein ACE5LU_09135 [Anaerolineae bacterium]
MNELLNYQHVIFYGFDRDEELAGPFLDMLNRRASSGTVSKITQAHRSLEKPKIPEEMAGSVKVVVFRVV